MWISCPLLQGISWAFNWHECLLVLYFMLHAITLQWPLALAVKIGLSQYGTQSTVIGLYDGVFGRFDLAALFAVAAP